MNTNHNLVREVQKWTSFGKNFNEAPKRRSIKDISDSHLLHIIGHLVERQHMMSLKETLNPYVGKHVMGLTDTLKLMLDECEYRAINKIYIPEYGKWNSIRNAIRTFWNRMW